MYLKVQGFGRGGVQYGQGKEPHGWPTKSYSWKSFKGTARGCSMKMAEEIISAMLSAQDTNPEDLIDDGSGTDSNEDVGEDSDDFAKNLTSVKGVVAFDVAVRHAQSFAAILDVTT